MQPNSLLSFLAVLAVASASPLRRRCGNSTIPTPTNVVTSTLTSTSTAVVPTLPATGSGTQLQGPGNATLKHILVGHGIQNYTCGAAGAAATSIGALAVVWDITDLYPGSSSSSLSADDFSLLTSKVLRTTEIPLNMAVDGTSGAVVAAPFPAPVDLSIEGIASAVKFMGHHFFDISGTPTFDLSGAGDGELFKGKKDANVSAPSDADEGLDPATGAVDWLRLSDKGTSTGVSLVYRVMTAGGDPETCADAGQNQSIPYTAQYWVYSN